MAGLSCPAGWIRTLGAGDVTLGLDGQVVVLGAVPLDRLLAGEGDVGERVPVELLSPVPEAVGTSCWIRSLPAGSVMIGPPVVRMPLRCPATTPRTRTAADPGGDDGRPGPLQGPVRRGDVPFQKAASSTSMSALSVFSTMVRSEVRRGRTCVVKNRVAASLPS